MTCLAMGLHATQATPAKAAVAGIGGNTTSTSMVRMTRWLLPRLISALPDEMTILCRRAEKTDSFANNCRATRFAIN